MSESDILRVLFYDICLAWCSPSFLDVWSVESEIASPQRDALRSCGLQPLSVGVSGPALGGPPFPSPVRFALSVSLDAIPSSAVPVPWPPPLLPLGSVCCPSTWPTALGLCSVFPLSLFFFSCFSLSVPLRLHLQGSHGSFRDCQLYWLTHPFIGVSLPISVWFSLRVPTFWLKSLWSCMWPSFPVNL